MAEVCIALVPACIAGCILLGWGALLQLAIASISAVLAEFVYLLCCKKSFKEILDQFDFSSLVTGMLVGMNMYANSKWYVPMLASIFAIVVVKMLFGGTGKNIVNPAITGRIFAFISFGAAFGGTMYFVNESGNASKVLSPITGGYIQGATPCRRCSAHKREATPSQTSTSSSERAFPAVSVKRANLPSSSAVSTL